MDPVSIIGLALAVYPILSHAFTQYKEGAEYFQNWKRYRTRFEGFTREIDGQSYLFENVIRGLVFEGPRPISSKDVMEDTFLNRLRDKNDPIWSTDVLLETVKIRLGHRFSWFMDTIQQVYGILEELSKTLEISEVSEGLKSHFFSHGGRTNVWNSLKNQTTLPNGGSSSGNESGTLWTLASGRKNLKNYENWLKIWRKL